VENPLRSSSFRQRLDELTTGDGRPLPRHFKTQICGELDRIELLLKQIKAAEAERDALRAELQASAFAPARRMLLDLKGIGPEFAANLWLEAFFRRFNSRPSSRLTLGWRQRLGKADRSIASRAFPKPEIRDCEPLSSSSPGYGCATSRNQRWPCGSKNEAAATAAA
jgi:transposase